MGHSKHRSAPPRRDRRRLLGILAAIAVVGASAGAWAIMSTADAGQEDGTPRQVAVDDDSPAASPTATTSDAASDVSSSALAQCQAEVAAGKAAADAAYQSYRDWSGHVQAQLDLDADRITVEQTRAIWADTKSRGNSDVAAFDAAYAAYHAVAGTCGQSGGLEGDVAARCTASTTAVNAAVATGAKVNSGWAAHVKMMADKGQIGAGYHQMWIDMVHAAPGDFGPFTAAYDALLKAPACDATG